MTTLSLSYCSILILLYVTDVKKLSRKNIYILIIFAFILILEYIFYWHFTENHK
jgi:predicted negative regulator of RcsB-dependent stress response